MLADDPIGATINHYRIVSKLGEGGMGVVYEAEDLTLGRHAALKFCSNSRDDPKLRASLLKEARAASALSHPNIATVYEFVENSGGDPFIAMELVSGASLRDILARGPLTREETLKVATGVASALAEAHRHGIIHRDIKPANIHLTSSGEVRVLDFGIARAPGLRMPGAETAEAATRTLEGFSGTPLYMSPEQATGEQVDARTDLFSLGAVIYECLTGKSPFVADNLTSIMARLITAEPPPPSRNNPKAPPYLDRIVLKLLAKDRRARYQSADELLADLRAPSRLSFPKPSRRTVMAAAAVIAAVAAGAPVWWWLGRRHHDPAPAAIPWYRDGAAALHYGSYHRASKALARAVEIDPAYAMAHAYLAEAWYELDYLERAKDELLKAMSPRGSLPEIEALHLDAVRQTVTGEFADASQKFRQVVELSPAGEQSGALLDLGRAQERNQDTRKAMATYSEAVRVDPQNTAAWLRLGALQSRIGARTDAAQSLDRAENIFQAASNVEGATECLYVRARFAHTPAEARAFITKALDAARVTGDDQQQVKLLLLSSGDYLDAGQTGAALDDANRAIDIARAAGIENLASRGLIDLGNALFVKGRTADALRTIEDALDIARRNHEKRSEARALVNLGSIRIQTGDAAEGWRDVQSALAYYRHGSFRNEAAIALILLGRAARNKGDFDQARRAFEETRSTIEAAGPSLPLALAQEGLASLAELQDRWPLALTLFEEARRDFEAIGNSSGTATNQANVALMHALLGHANSVSVPVPDASSVTAVEIILLQEHFAEARSRAQAMLDAADPKDLETRRGASLVLGLALARSGAPARGLEACRKSIELAHAAAQPAAEADAELAAAEAALAAGDRADAAQFAAHARAYFQTTHKPESLWRADVLITRSGGRDSATTIEAAAALGELQAAWPADDFKSYLDRPVIHRLHAELTKLKEHS